MPWKDRSAMDEKASFILEWESGESTVRVVQVIRDLAHARLPVHSACAMRCTSSGGLKEQSRAPRRVWRTNQPGTWRRRSWSGGGR